MQGVLRNKPRCTSNASVEIEDIGIKRRERTGILAAFFLFQYSLLIPLMRFVSPSVLIAFSGLALLVATFIINRALVLNIRSILVVFVLSMVMAIKVIIDGTEPRVIIDYLMICLPPVFFFSYKFDIRKFMSLCYRLSYINFFLLFALPFTGNRSYMRFGNGMVLTSIFMYLLVFRSNKYSENLMTKRKAGITKVFDIVIFLVSSFETTLYGNRGALVILLAFIALDTLLIYRNHVLRNFFIILTGFIAVFNLEHILDLLISISTRFGVFSYSIRKYQYQLMVGLEGVSSGRSRLYQNAIDEMIKNPILGNKMVVYDGTFSYVHNLFLQVGRDLGVFAMIILMVFVIYCIYLLFSRKIDLNKKTIIAVFFCVSVVRLLLSSNLWERPEFWALICIVLNYKSLLCDQSDSLSDGQVVSVKKGGA